MQKWAAASAHLLLQCVTRRKQKSAKLKTGIGRRRLGHRMTCKSHKKRANPDECLWFLFLFFRPGAENIPERLF